MYTPKRPAPRPSLTTGVPTAVTTTTTVTSPSWKDRKRSVTPGGDTDVAQPVFEHRARELHLIEHNALNAEVRGKCEVPMRDWGESIKGVADFVARTAPLGEVANARLLTALAEYQEGYRCTEDLTETIEDVLARYGLSMPPARLCSGMKVMTAYDAETIFSELSGAPNLLQIEDLEAKRCKLESLDDLTGRPVSSCSVALHDRSHCDPTVPLRRELKDGAPFLRDKEVVIDAIRARRKDSLDENEMLQAREALQDEIMKGSELVSHNVLRMDLFIGAEADAAQFREDMDSLVAAAQAMVLAFSDDASEKARLESDIATIRKIIADLCQQQKAEQDELRGRMGVASNKVVALSQQEAAVWAEVIAKMEQLRKINTEKQSVAHAALNDIESVDRKVLASEEVVCVLQDHLDKLREGCRQADNLNYLGKAFGGYVDTMCPRLLENVEEADDAIRQLKIAEAALVISRYDRFSDAAEDMCQRTRNRLDRLDREHRQKELDGDVAASTFDPNGAAYLEALAGIEAQTEGLRSYLGTLIELQESRRSDVDPTIDFAMDVLAEEPLDAPRVIRGNTALIETGKVPKRADRDLITLDSPVRRREVDITRHPQLLAALRSLEDDGVQLAKAKQYMEGEQAAVEGKMANVRRLVVQSKNARQTRTPLLLQVRPTSQIQ